MAKIKIRNINQLANRFKINTRVAILKTLRDKRLRDKAGRIIEQDIRDNFNEIPSQATKEFREFFEQFNQTHPDYRRGKINITFTGELLRDLATNVKLQSQELALVFEHSNKKHKQLKSGARDRGRRIQVTSLSTRNTRDVRDTFATTPKKTHKEISGYIQDLGYDYIQLSSGGQSKIVDLLREAIFNNIKKELTS